LHDPAFYNLGYAYHRTGALPEAIQSYELALKLNPTSAECHFNLASAYMDNNEKDKAINSYKESLEYEQENIDCCFHIAKI
jgi:tetratricopeptide (TPR) repeat protein